MSNLNPNAQERQVSPPSSSQVASLAISLVILVGLAAFSLRQEPLPNFAELDIPTKKQTFFEFLRPYVQSANAEIAQDRAKLKDIAKKLPAQELSWFEQRFIENLAADYDLELAAPPDHKTLTERLLRRVDTIPASLILVQAAKESGWGTSRFARAGYSFFGQHCFAAGCGFLPSARAPGRKHEVAKFDSVQEAVDAYLHNINTHNRYKQLRTLRASMRATEKKLSGIYLADGLWAYSERRDKYIAEIKKMIRYNNLE